MSIEVAAARESVGSTAAQVAPAPNVRTVRVGLVGLGQVGQAVARLAHDTPRLTQSGLRFRVLGALVRDITRPRRCPKPARVTTNAAAFLRGNYDVVIEALAGIEPARTIVSRLLGRGIPVVTANKALVAAHGAELAALAVRRSTTLRYEATALAGVPFLGALAARPLVSDVHQFAAVVNGTSNFILSKLEDERCSFDEALNQARTLGLTEPDPSRDLDGQDAADKLSLLAAIFGWGAVSSSAIEVHGIRGLTVDDVAVARTLDATIKPLVWASRSSSTLNAFIGPALVSNRHPLAALSGTLSGIQLSGRFVSDLFFSGPGAGPEITAASILDDAVEAVSSVPRLPRAPRRNSDVASIGAPITRWFVRVRFPGLIPDASAASHILAASGLQVEKVTEPAGGARWVLLGTASRQQIDTAIFRLRETHRVHCHAIRAL
jgi:homoserine dehydrogenase